MRNIAIISALMAGAIGSVTPAHAAPGQRSRADMYNRARIPGVIYGHCTVLASIGSSLPSACSELKLVLKANSGEEVLHAQTDSQGGFKFKVTTGTKYTLEPESADYEIVTPKRPVMGGDVLDLKLNPK